MSESIQTDASDSARTSLVQETINVTGKIVSPGFIDILADNSMDPDSTYDTFEKYKVTDGVTTALQMHGGSPESGTYYRRFGRLPHFVNYGVSTFVMALRGRGPNVAMRKKLIEQNLDEGALGVSHSLEYQPTPYEELLEYAQLAKKYERPMFLHLRYSSQEEELTGVDEAVQLARESGVHVHIDHLHSTGGTFQMESALDRIPNGKCTGTKSNNVCLSLLILGHLPVQPPIRPRMARALRNFLQ